MRNLPFISHANPEDNIFSRWLALHLAGEPPACEPKIPSIILSCSTATHSHQPSESGILRPTGRPALTRHVFKPHREVRLQEVAMYILMVRLTVKQDHIDDFIKASIADATGSVLQERGCRRFDIIQDETNPRLFAFTERSTSTGRPSSITPGRRTSPSSARR